ncbi:YqcC family protein [Vibrio sinaloensis]|uniref:YqcC family protein n=1 Tax=Photobacterium sp. (strain ATCC 43367) TaxID=379097 RepID=UPI002F40C4A8
MTKAQQLLPLLQQLPLVMRELGLWQQDTPSTEELSSNEPFSVDTLKPEQWLQWVFLPKMTALVEQKMPLPTGFSISPYFEESWKSCPEYAPVLSLLVSIDEVCR